MCRGPQTPLRGPAKIIICSSCRKAASTAGEIKSQTSNPSSVQQACGHTSPEKAPCPSLQPVQPKYFIHLFIFKLSTMFLEATADKASSRKPKGSVFLLSKMACRHFCKTTDKRTLSTNMLAEPK